MLWVSIWLHITIYPQSKTFCLRYRDNLSFLYKSTFLVSPKLDKRPCLADIVVVFIQLKGKLILLNMLRQLNSRDGFGIPQDLRIAGFLLKIQVIKFLIDGQLNSGFLSLTNYLRTKISSPICLDPGREIGWLLF